MLGKTTAYVNKKVIKKLLENPLFDTNNIEDIKFIGYNKHTEKFLIRTDNIDVVVPMYKFDLMSINQGEPYGIIYQNEINKWQYRKLNIQENYLKIGVYK